MNIRSKINYQAKIYLMMTHYSTIYWISTVLISVFLSLSAYSYIFSESTILGFKDLGFPDFFRIELAVLKILAAIIILLPFIPTQIKEWTYAGIGLFLITAMIAHIAHKDSIALQVLLIVLFVLLIISNIQLHKLTN
jgi:hypothetical protein